jgi:hypothetical protein
MSGMNCTHSEIEMFSDGDTSIAYDDAPACNHWEESMTKKRGPEKGTVRALPEKGKVIVEKGLKEGWSAQCIYEKLLESNLKIKLESLRQHLNYRRKKNPSFPPSSAHADAKVRETIKPPPQSAPKEVTKVAKEAPRQDPGVTPLELLHSVALRIRTAELDSFGADPQTIAILGDGTILTRDPDTAVKISKRLSGRP